MATATPPLVRRPCQDHSRPVAQQARGAGATAVQRLTHASGRERTGITRPTRDDDVNRSNWGGGTGPRTRPSCRRGPPCVGVGSGTGGKGGRCFPPRFGLRYTRLVRFHSWVDERSHALHDAVASKLECDPALIDVARNNLTRWLGVTPAPAWLEWRQLLETTPLAELTTLLRSRDERANRLRQSSPFAGLLTPQERRAIFDRYASRRA